MKEIHSTNFIPVDISEQDVIEAMKRIEGYIDITPGDFKEVYQSAYALAIKRLLDSLTADKIMTFDLKCLKISSSTGKSISALSAMAINL